jgi:hypothetical protein
MKKTCINRTRKVQGSPVGRVVVWILLALATAVRLHFVAAPLSALELVEQARFLTESRSGLEAAELLRFFTG